MRDYRRQSVIANRLHRQASAPPSLVIGTFGVQNTFQRKDEKQHLLVAVSS
jgi:hypothetical protein